MSGFFLLAGQAKGWLVHTFSLSQSNSCKSLVKTFPHHHPLPLFLTGLPSFRSHTFCVSLIDCLLLFPSPYPHTRTSTLPCLMGASNTHTLGWVSIMVSLCPPACPLIEHGHTYSGWRKVSPILSVASIGVHMSRVTWPITMSTIGCGRRSLNAIPPIECTLKSNFQCETVTYFQVSARARLVTQINQ